MSTDEYAPSEAHFRDYYVGGRSEYDPEYTDDMAARRDWGTFLARVRRDAARDALDGLVQTFQWGGWSDTLKRGSQPADLMGNANRVTGWMRDYRDTHYPEETEER